MSFTDFWITEESQKKYINILAAVRVREVQSNRQGIILQETCMADQDKCTFWRAAGLSFILAFASASK